MTSSREQFLDLREREQETLPQLASLSPKLLNLGKKDIVNMAKHIVDDINEGNLDLVNTFIEIKKAKLYFETLEENVKGIVYGKSIVSKGQILKLHNVEIEASDLGVKWDFKGCNDAILDRLYETLSKAKQDVTDRENYLKVITTQCKQVDMETGEEYLVNPAVRSCTNGYTFSIKG